MRTDAAAIREAIARARERAEAALTVWQESDISNALYEELSSEVEDAVITFVLANSPAHALRQCDADAELLRYAIEVRETDFAHGSVPQAILANLARRYDVEA